MNEYGKALQCHGEGQAGEKGVVYARGLASAEEIIHFQLRYFCIKMVGHVDIPNIFIHMSVKDIITYVRKDVLGEALRLCISPAPLLATLVICLYCITFKGKKKFYLV